MPVPLIYKITQASHSDLSSIQSLENSCFDAERFTKTQLDYLITKAHGIVYKAERGGEIVGYLSLLFSKRHHYLRIYSIAIAPNYRHKGIAKALMDMAEKYANIRGAKKITLEVRIDNEKAINLYESFNFNRTAIKDAYYDKGIDAWYMTKKI